MSARTIATGPLGGVMYAVKAEYNFKLDI